MTGDAKPGAIGETRAYDDALGHKRLSLATRSDLTIEAQVSAPGSTWIDRQLLTRQSALSTGGFGAEVRDAMGRRIDHLVEQGLARRQGQRVILARDLLNTLRRRELGKSPPSYLPRLGLLIARPPKASTSRPARYCTGYLGDIGVPLDPNPMDFSAWAEVFLDGRWYT